MRFDIKRILLLALATVLLPVPVRAQGATIDPGTTWGKWDGWGCSLCWWAKAFGNRDDLADVLYTTRMVNFQGESLPGLGLNIVRYNAGASSWQEANGVRMSPSPEIRPARQMEGFWFNGASANPASKSWDWSVDANQRLMMQKAQARGADRFELFSNSPMWWMLSNQNPSGSEDGKTDNLPPENYQQHAIYLATIAKYAKDHWGIAFTSVEPFNEPLSAWWKADRTSEGCHVSIPAQAAIVNLLRAELDQRGLQATPISASDNNSYDEGVRNWNAFDAATRQVVGQINVHGYEQDHGRRDLLFQAAQAEGKRLWNSEYGEADATGMQLARNLNLDLHQLHPTGWCYWQAVDGAFQSGWGLLQGNPAKKIIGHANPKYFVLAQYSRHIRPGMMMIESGQPNTVAAYDANQHSLVLVTLNEGPAQKLSYDLSKFDVKGSITRWETEPFGAARYEVHHDGQLDNKSFEFALPANSIETFEITDVTIPLR